MSHDSGFPPLDDDEFSGDLLRAGREDAMSPEARKRVIAALGASATVATAAGLGSAGVAGGKGLLGLLKGGLFAWAGKGAVAVALVSAATWTAVELAPRALTPSVTSSVTTTRATASPAVVPQLDAHAPAAPVIAAAVPEAPAVVGAPVAVRAAVDVPAPVVGGEPAGPAVLAVPAVPAVLQPSVPSTPPSVPDAALRSPTPQPLGGGVVPAVNPPGDSPPMAAPPAPAAAPPASPAEAKPKTDTLAQETAMLAAARRAVMAGSPAVALGHLDTFARSFPGSRMAPEALRIRLDALVASGRKEEAATIARALLQQNPNGPQAARLRALVEK